MSTIIDEKVVSMQFDNKQFQNGASETISTLDRLKAALDRDVSGQNFDQLDRAARSVDFSSIQSGVEALTDRFSTLGIVGITVIQNITNAIMNKLASGLNYAMDKIVQGGITRAMNIENAHFQLQGLIDEERGGEEEVKRIMDQASESVSGTAYAYDSAAKAASMFAATGMTSGAELEKALKAVAGVAATTNSDYDSMAQIFTTVAGQGRVMADQLNQLASRGLNAAASLKEYFNAVSSGKIDASESVKEQIKAMSESITMTEKEVEARKEALNNQVEAEQKASNQIYKEKQKALNKEYDAVKKTLDKEYQTIKESLDKQYNAKKKQLDKNYEELSKSIDKEIEAVQKANQKQVDEANKAYRANVDAYRKATNERIALIDKEYLESIKLVDEERYNKLKAIDDQIKAINDLADAEEKERKEKERADKIAELNNSINTAKSTRYRKQKEEELAEYLEKVQQEELAEQRRAQIDELNQQREAINEEADLKKEAIRDQRDQNVEAIQEESEKTLESMDEAHDAEMEALRESQAAQIEAMREAKAERLEALRESQNLELETYRKSQNEELEVVREGQSAQLEDLREKQSEQLEVLRDAQNKRLASIKESIAKEQKALSAGSGFAEVTEADIRDLVSKGKVSFEIFSEAMATTFGDHAKDANKTFTGAMANIGAAFARTGAMFVSPIIQQEGPMVKLFNEIREKINDINKVLAPIAETITTKLNDAITKIHQKVRQLNFVKVVAQFNEETGKWERTVVGASKSVETLFKIVGTAKNIFEALLSVIKPIKEAFIETFDLKKVNINGFVDTIYNLTKNLKLNEQQSESVKTAFKGIFDVVQLLIDGITLLLNKIFNLNIGMTDAEKPTRSFSDVIFGLIGRIGEVLSGIVEFIRALITGKSDVEVFSKAVSFLSGVFEFLKNLWSGVAKVLDPLIRKFKDLGAAFVDAAKSTDPIKAFFSILNGTLIAGILKGLKDIVLNFQKVSKAPTSFLTNINKILSEVTNYLKAMTTAVNAKALKDIAASVLMLAGAVFLVSSIDADALGRSMIAILALLGAVTGVFITLQQLSKSAPKIADQINGFLGKLGTAALAASLMAVATSVILLAVAVKMLSKLSVKELLKGLGAVGVLLLELAGFTNLVGGEKKLAGIGTGLLLVSTSVLILYNAVKKFADLSWDQIIKGLAGVGGVLLELAGFARIAGGSKNMISIGVGMILLGAALNIVYDAFAGFAKLNWEEIAKGAIAMGAALGEMVLALKFTPPTAILSGGGLWILADAIEKVQPAFEGFGNMGWEEIAKAAVGMGAALTEMVLALNFTTPISILSGGGLWVLAQALEDLAPTFQQFGSMSWGEVARAATGMGSALTEMTLALNFATPIGIISGGGFWVLAKALQEVQPVFESFGSMSWGEVARAATGMGSALTEMTLALDFTTPSAILSGGGLWVLAKALDDIAPAFQQFGSMSWGEVGRAATGMGAALTEMTLALDFTLPTSIISGGALWVLADAVEKITPAFKSLGEMSWEQIKIGATGLLAVIGELSGLEALVGIFSGPIALGAAAFETAVLSLYTASLMLPGMTQNISDAITIINKLNETDFQNGLTRIGEALATMGDGIKHFSLFAPVGASAMNTLAGAIQKLVGPMIIFSSLDPLKLSTAFIILGNGIGKFGTSIKKFGLLSGVGAGSMIKIANAIRTLAIPMTIFSQLNPISLSKSFDILGEAMKTFGKSLKSFGLLSGIGADAMLKVSEAISKLAPAMLQLSLIHPIQLALDLGILSNSFKAFGESLDGFGLLDSIKTDAILEMAEAVGLMAPALLTLSIIPAEKLSSALESLGGAFESFGTALSNTPFWFAQTRAEGIGALIDNITKLAEVLPPFIEIPHSKAKRALETLSEAFQGFATALSETPWFMTGTRAEGIGALIENIQRLAEVLPGFIEIPHSKAKKALDTLTEGFTGFANALGEAPFWGVKDRGSAISILCNSITSLTDGLKEFLTIEADSEAIQAALDTISGAFASFGQALKKAPFWNPEDRGAAISILCNSIESLANGVASFLVLIKMSDAETVKDVLDTIATAFSDFGTAIKKAPLWNTKSRAEGIGLLVSYISELADGVSALVDIGAEDAKTILDTLGIAFQNFGDAIKKSPFWGNEKRTESIGKVVGYISNLKDPINTLAQIDTDVFTNVVTGLALFLNRIGVSIQTFSWDKEKIENFRGAVLAVRSFESIDGAKLMQATMALDHLILTTNSMSRLNFAGMTSFSMALTRLANEGIKAFMNAFGNTDNIINKTINNFINEIIKKINNSSILFIAPATTVITSFLNTFVGSMTGRHIVITMAGFVTMIITAIKATSPKFTEVGIDTASAFLIGFIEPKTLSVIKTTVDFFINNILSMLKLEEPKFTQEGINVATRFSQGMSNGGSSAGQAGRNLVTAVINGLRGIENSLRDAGRNVVQGFVNGINERLRDAEEAGRNLGNAAYDASRQSLDVRSPSRKMQQVGSFAGEGFIRGLRGWVEDAMSVGADLGDNAAYGLENAIDNINSIIQNGEDFNPVITPVLDLDTLRDQSNQIGGMLDLTSPIQLAQNASISFSGGISKMFDDLEASIPENSNEDVVDAINDLNTNMVNVMSTLGKLQVVLDTGTMVGELVNPIDQALGFNSVLNKRGVR